MEIIAGSIFGSMAWLADGWHMVTHVAAFMITIIVFLISIYGKLVQIIMQQ